jgi:hypothetical protein
MVRHPHADEPLTERLAMLTTHRLAFPPRVDATGPAPQPGRQWQLPGGLGREENPPVLVGSR